MEPKRSPIGAHVLPKGAKVAQNPGPPRGRNKNKKREHSAMFFTGFRVRFRGQSRITPEPVWPGGLREAFE